MSDPSAGGHSSQLATPFSDSRNEQEHISQRRNTGTLTLPLLAGNVCRLLISFANRLDPDEDRQKVGPDLDGNCLTL